MKNNASDSAKEKMIIKKEKNKITKKKIALRIFLAIAAIAALCVIFVMSFKEWGKRQLSKSLTAATAPSVEFSQNSTETEQTQDEADQNGWVKYNGNYYAYNQNIRTFLFMGIDQKGEVEKIAEGLKGGQADTLFLLVLNPDSKKISVVAIDRNTMTDVDVYDYFGKYVSTKKMQICVQHGYGDGNVKSAEYTVKAVSGLFYNLPIHGYCAINMSAIPEINDVVGGVDITSPDDIYTNQKKTNLVIQKGQETHLTGMQAYYYLHWRDTDIFGSAAGRLKRQKQYLTAYFAKAKSELKTNPALPVNLMQKLNKYMTTDITAQETTYLASEMSSCSFSTENMESVPGQTVSNGQFEAYNVDETGLKEMLIRTFYEKVQPIQSHVQVQAQAQKKG